MTFHKTLYIITNLSGICAISGLLGAVYYNDDRKKSEQFVTFAAVSTIVLLSSPFISNLAIAVADINCV